LGTLNSRELILILDFGAQYVQLIARKIRECKVYCEIVPCTTPAEKILARKPKGLVLSGGPASIYEPGAPMMDPALLTAGIPILGICYGQQLLAHLLGGVVKPATKKEYGRTELRVTGEPLLFSGLNKRLICWMSHGDHVVEMPQGFRVAAKTQNCPSAAIENAEKNLFGVQFHPEVVHTPWGKDLLSNFLTLACKCKRDWTASSFVEHASGEIRETVGKERVLCGLSGGVDSCTAAALVHRAIGDQLVCMFIDHGLLRKGEAESVTKTFSKHFKLNLIAVESQQRFLDRLQGITDPEEKRKVIGNEFIKVFEEEAEKLGRFAFFAQGTLYPDVIESGTATAATIKTHHNVGGLPEKMNFRLLEPLRELFKDEVREIAYELSLPDEIVWRQPFPGPGLAIRILGEVTPERLNILREADAVVIEEIKRAGLYTRLWQSFAVLTPIRSVGVMGDQRTYGYVVVLRAVTSDDAMTANWAELPFEVLESVGSRIMNEVQGVNRVVYDISSKPPATIEWE